MSLKKSYEIFADYRQFYLMDAEALPDAPSDYTDFDIRRRIKAAKNIVVIQPEHNTTVPVELEVSDSAPEQQQDDDDFTEWSHVAEASLELPSGRLSIDECCGERIDEIRVPPGSYRVRTFYGDLDKLSDDELGGEDHYRIVLWAAPLDEIKVLKQYEYPNVSE